MTLSGSTSLSMIPAFSSSGLAGLLELGPRLDDGLEGLEDLLHCLEELGLVGVALLEAVEDGLQILVCDCHAISPWWRYIRHLSGLESHNLY